MDKQKNNNSAVLNTALLPSPLQRVSVWTSLDSLGEGKWLDDEAINCYGMALAASSDGRVAAFSPHWQTSMMAGRTRKAIKERLEARNAHRASMWLLPYNRWQSHWALFVVDFVTKSIIHIDTMKQRPNNLDIVFVRRLIDSVSANDAPVNWTSWQLVVPSATPRQPDTYSCGTRVCYYAAVAATGLQCGFDDSEMRARIQRTVFRVRVSKLCSRRRARATMRKTCFDLSYFHDLVSISGLLL